MWADDATGRVPSQLCLDSGAFGVASGLGRRLAIVVLGRRCIVCGSKAQHSTAQHNMEQHSAATAHSLQHCVRAPADSAAHGAVCSQWVGKLARSLLAARTPLEQEGPTRSASGASANPCASCSAGALQAAADKSQRSFGIPAPRY